MEAHCFSLFSIIFCIADLTLPNMVRDLVLTQSWNFGIQRFLVSRYFGCTDQSWTDPERVFKVLPVTLTFSSTLLLIVPALHPVFRHLFILKFLEIQSIYRAIQLVWNTNTAKPSMFCPHFSSQYSGSLAFWESARRCRPLTYSSWHEHKRNSVHQ